MADESADTSVDSPGDEVGSTGGIDRPDGYSPSNLLGFTHPARRKPTQRNAGGGGVRTLVRL